jgi:predicted ATPase
LTEAEEFLLRSIDLAARQSSPALELRAATSLALFWSEQDQLDRARDVLSRVYGRFTEGFESTDLKAAKRILDELG